MVLAKAIDADGVHIGGDDTPIGVARKILGDKKIIGVSCYGDIEAAKKAAKEGADYVAFGSFFSSKTKPNAKKADIGVLKEAKKLGVPVCAIGGIEAANADTLINAGADMLAVISALWSGDVERNALDFCGAFRKCR